MGFKDSMTTVEVAGGKTSASLIVELPPHLERHYFSISAVDITGKAIDIFGEKLNEAEPVSEENTRRREISFMAEGNGGAWFHVGSPMVARGNLSYIEQPCIHGQFFSGSCIAEGFQTGDKITLRVASYL